MMHVLGGSGSLRRERSWAERQQRRARSKTKPSRRSLRGHQRLESRVLLAADPIAHWRAQDLNDDVDSGAIVTEWVDSKSGIAATTDVNGEPRLIQGALGGRSVLRLDGSDGADLLRVAFDANPMRAADDFTLAIVFATSTQQLVGESGQWYEHTGLVDSSNLGFTQDWGVSINALGQVAAGMGSGFGQAPKTVYSSTRGLNDGEAHVAIYSRQGSTLSLYVDNGTVDSLDDASAAARATTVDLVIGGIQSGGKPYTGDISEVRIYDQAMDSAEAASLHDEIVSFYNNAPPVAVDDAYTVAEDPLLFATRASDGVLANDTDAESDPLTATIVENTQHGQTTLRPDGSFVYVPDKNFFGTDSFTYTANDFRPSSVATVTIEVTPVYDPAVSIADSYQSLSGEVLSVDSAAGLLSNDENPDQVPLTAILDSDVTNGSLVLNSDGSFRYDPQGFAGTASFAYKVDDGTTISAASTVTLIVNTPPVASPDDYDVTEDVVFLADLAAGVLSNDTDADGDPITATLVDGPTYGSLEFNEDGTFNYVPSPDYFGPDSFAYKLSDWNDESNVVQVQLNVAAVDDLPQGNADIYFAPVGESIERPLESGVLANDSDIDSTSLTASLETEASHGVVTLNPDGSFSYVPNAGFTGTDVFTYRVSDSSNASEAVNVDLYVGVSPVRISEFLAANVSSLETRIRETAEDSFRGDTLRKDWIELENLTTAPLDIGGFHLTDRRGNPTKWRIPEGTVIAPAGYQVVVASRANIVDPALDQQGLLHTNFTLNVEGEYLAVASPNGSVLHEFDTYPRQAPNVSYGFTSTGSLGYLTESSPGGPNANAYADVVSDPTASVDRGFYSDPFQVEFNVTTPDAEIRYTTNGSDPTATTGQVYSGPIDITTTTTLRAAAFREGHLPSRVTTHTYLFINDVIQQGNSPEGYPDMFGLGPPNTHPWAPRPADYEMDPEITQSPKYRDRMDDALLAIPSISIVTSIDNLFDTETGIYQNTDNHGVDWERPASIEMIMPDGSTAFQIDAGIRIQGGASREPWKSPKHGFRLKFKGVYGYETLNYDWFGGNAVDEFDEIVLRAGANQAYTHHNNFNGDNRGRAQYIRDQWANDTYRALGHPAPHADYAHLYINGLYWGLYNPKERPTNSFMEGYLGGEKEDYDVLNAGTVLDGNDDAWQQLNSRDFRDLDDPDLYAQFTELLDIDAYIDYMLMNHYGGNLDWDSHNWYAAASRQPGGKFLFIPWDSEFFFTSTNDNVVRKAEASPGRLFRNLQKNDEFKMQLADRMQELFFNDGLLTPSSVVERWEARSAQIDEAIIGESARWGDFRRDVDRQGIAGPFVLLERDVQWVAERERLLNDYFPVRTEIVVEQYRRANLFPSIDAPAFNQRGGSIDSSFAIELSSDTGTIYYTTDGSDPRLPGGAINPDAIEYTGAFRLTDPADVRTRVLEGDEWSALEQTHFLVDATPAHASNLRISEINYNPSPPTPEEVQAGHDNNDDFEFIELVNISDRRIDLRNVRFEQMLVAEDEIGIAFDFGQGSVEYLEPGGRVLVVEDTEAFAARYGSDQPVAGQWAGRLSNNSEMITLVAGTDMIHQFAYDDVWHPATDGNGHTLEIIDAASANLAAWGQSTSWKASVQVGGSPGSGSAVRVLGDSNGDGIFDSSDLVLVFQAGEYEDNILGNSTFEEGDWNSDGDFTSGDLVAAFKAGTFVPAIGDTARRRTDLDLAVLDHVFSQLEDSRPLITEDAHPTELLEDKAHRI